ncbi:MAG: hypothetical protein Q7R81_07695 [Candidatus Peregrinibacteria bacterium]|nr:hypothetical protein [Candidatus Peregrinibacteria bacterium]
MTRVRTSIGLSLLALSLLLTACEKKDKDLVVDFAKEWGKLHGLYDENGNLTGKAMARGAGQNLPNWLKPDVKGPDGETDPAGNAAVDAGAVVKDIMDNDKLVDQAQLDLAKKPPDQKAAMDKYTQAVKARPGDWYYRNRRALLHMEMGNETAAGKDFRAAEDACGESKLCLDAYESDRKAILSGRVVPPQ